MPYLITVLTIVFLVLCLLSSGSRERKRACAAGQKPAVVMSAAGEQEPFLLAGLTRAEVSRRLEQLNQSKTPTELKVGAMCYAPRMLPGVIEYVCPACGQKTAFSASSGLDIPQLSSVIPGLPGSRALVKQITAVTLVLDESELCRKCSPKVVSPHVWLVVKYPGQKPYRVKDVTLDDLRLIDEFLSGKEKHRTFNDGESPLKNHLPRLKELLGVGGKQGH